MQLYKEDQQNYSYSVTFLTFTLRFYSRKQRRTVLKRELFESAQFLRLKILYLYCLNTVFTNPIVSTSIFCDPLLEIFG